jgi:hypothetical protein
LDRRIACLGALLSACGADEGGAISVVHDACRPLTVAVEGGSLEQQASVDDALALWHGRGVESPRRAGADDPPADLVVRFQIAAGNFHGLYDGEQATIFVNDGLADRHARAIAIAHELGHAFGLTHIDRGERDSVMNRANLTVAPTGADAEAIVALWGACPPARSSR